MSMTEAEEDRADAWFHALADRTRRDILRRVLAGEHSVSALARSYDMSFAAVQKHVAVLERAGLLTKRRQGREALASGDVQAVRSVGAMLTELEELEGPRLGFTTAHNTPAALAALAGTPEAERLAFHALAGRLHLFPIADDVAPIVARLDCRDPWQEREDTVIIERASPGQLIVRHISVEPAAARAERLVAVLAIPADARVVVKHDARLPPEVPRIGDPF